MARFARHRADILRGRDNKTFADDAGFGLSTGRKHTSRHSRDTGCSARGGRRRERGRRLAAGPHRRPATADAIVPRHKQGHVKAEVGGGGGGGSTSSASSSVSHSDERHNKRAGKKEQQPGQADGSESEANTATKEGDIAGGAVHRRLVFRGGCGHRVEEATRGSRADRCA